MSILEGYKIFLKHVADKKGFKNRGNWLVFIMDFFAAHETGQGSKPDPAIVQKGGGPGRGIFQFENLPGGGGWTALVRTINALKKAEIQIPEWIKKLYIDGVKKKVVDFSKLNHLQQRYLWLGNYLEKPGADLSTLKITNEDTAETYLDKLAEFWATHHWAGPKKDRAKKIKRFKSNLKANHAFFEDVIIKESMRRRLNIIIG